MHLHGGSHAENRKVDWRYASLPTAWWFVPSLSAEWLLGSEWLTAEWLTTKWRDPWLTPSTISIEEGGELEREDSVAFRTAPNLRSPRQLAQLGGLDMAGCTNAVAKKTVVTVRGARFANPGPKSRQPLGLSSPTALRPRLSPLNQATPCRRPSCD